MRIGCIVKARLRDVHASGDFRGGFGLVLWWCTCSPGIPVLEPLFREITIFLHKKPCKVNPLVFNSGQKQYPIFCVGGLFNCFLLSLSLSFSSLSD